MIKLYKSDGFYEVNLIDLGLTFLSFDIEPISANHETEDIQGVEGTSIKETKLNSRKAKARVMYSQRTYEDFHRNKSKVYKLFNPLNYLYIIDEREPHKKWKMKVESISEITNKESRRDDEIEITFISESPYAKEVSETETKITKQTDFIVNKGDVYLDARKHWVQIRFKGNSDKLRIVNTTTNTQWQYKGTTNLEDEIYIDSIYPYKNNKSIFADTDYGVLEFKKGSNELKIYGVSGEFELNIKHYNLYV